MPQQNVKQPFAKTRSKTIFDGPWSRVYLMYSQHIEENKYYVYKISIMFIFFYYVYEISIKFDA